ncbi:MAG: hypothetical protein ACI8TQ_001312 [Planctomycetota bacterium]|jgi:hypothetical protein
MSNTNIESAIRASVDTLVEELTTIIRQAALETVQEALGGAVASVAGATAPRKAGRPKKAKAAITAKRKPGRPKKAAAAKAKPAKAKAKAKKSAPAPKKSGTRVRRSADDLEQTAGMILSYLSSNPGVGVDAISKGVRRTTKDTKRPIQMLLSAKQIRTEGQKRGTTYYAGKKGKKAARKAG